MKQPETDEERTRREAWEGLLRVAVETRATLLHPETGVVGQAARFWEAGTFHPPEGSLGEALAGEEVQKVVEEAVLELADGNAFLARVGAFISLSEAEAAVHAQVVESLRDLVTGAFVVLAAAPNADRGRAAAVVLAALRSQARALSASADG